MKTWHTALIVGLVLLVAAAGAFVYLSGDGSSRTAAPLSGLAALERSVNG